MVIVDITADMNLPKRDRYVLILDMIQIYHIISTLLGLFICFKNVHQIGTIFI